ncbi:type VI secretion system Vgr family protein [Noviherbaspirillum sp.]|jgi:type VI secretion system secreted protein VgrG|uniref:type VI secretion system Vgr family protein n=1 Tax=Noviherbaspirillum sp. TaxID=1926288 RepID=UPI0025E264DB|nr:type VI secretion system Vgr family protein [Noviherbaspirillum sp.]
MHFSEVAAGPPGSSTSSVLTHLAGQGRQAFLNSLSQHARLISIETPLGAGALIVERFAGRESMSGLFRLDVDCLASSAYFELKALIGKEVSLRVMLADGRSRSFHGIVGEASQLGSDGSLASYRLTLVPWLHQLTLRRDSYVFQDKTVLEILEDIFKDYPNASYRFDVKTALPQRSIAIQYRESDYEFVARLLAEEGLNFFFEHEVEQAGANPDDHGADMRHRLVVFDDSAALHACSQSEIRFHRTDVAETTDTITHFVQRRQIQSNAVALASWDYKNLVAHAAEESVQARPDAIPTLEIYEGSGAYRYADNNESARIARARAESLGLAQHVISGEGAARALSVGTWFSLIGHPDADGDYAVLSIEHRGANNLAHGAAELAQRADIEAGTYRNQFTCAPRATPIRPGYHFPKPVAPGVQTALVVGVASEEITTERDHRIKIQFLWQRGARATPGQLEHPMSSNAPGDNTSGTWVRVAEPAAGANWGASFIPRVGQEVCIDFIDGDIDRPVIVGQLYNGADLPPFHGGDNHPGALAGIKSKEYGASGFNQWAIDDTPGQLRQTVASTYGASQLNIGYLIRQSGNIRSAYRGIGFELATDAWSTLCGKRGIFLSTTQRAFATSTQLDTQEAQNRFKAASELAQTLSNAATQHQATPLTIQPGLENLKVNVTGKENADGHDVPAFEQPAALFDSQAGINTATPASSVHFAGQDITLTAESSMRATAGQAASIVAAKAASLFTHAGGAKVIAAKETVSVRAHTGPMDVLADQALTVTSSTANITLQAKNEILLASGGGYIKLAGANIDIHCPVSVSVKGSTHDFLGAGSVAADLPMLPDAIAKTKNWIAIQYRDADGEPVAGIGYKIKFDNGSVIGGKLDKNGHSHRENVPESAASVEYERRAAKPDVPWESLQKMVNKAKGRFASTSS